MRIGSGIARLLIGSCLFVLPLSAGVKKTIRTDLETGNDEHLCQVLRDNVKRTISLNSLRGLAKRENAQGLLDEIKATRNTKLKNLGISKGEFISLTHFINTLSDDKTCYYSKDATGLSHTIEYDASTKKYFIVLEGTDAYLDKGMKKTVTKALCYQKNGAFVVARAEQTLEMDRELSITKKFRGRPGLFKTLGISNHTDSDINYHTIYSKLYLPGSLQTVFQEDYKLSHYEKVRMAHSIAKGLKTLHNAGVVHRDLGVKNYLVNIPKGKPGRRKIEACIADFGRAQFATHVIPEPRVQGNTTYMAPEGHFYLNLTKDSYKKLDVFAMGCVFYRLVYSKKPEWQRTNYVMRDTRPVSVRYQEHKARVLRATAKKRAALRALKVRSANQEFEYLVLRMLHTDPKKRISANTVYSTLDKIYKDL